MSDSKYLIRVKKIEKQLKKENPYEFAIRFFDVGQEKEMEAFEKEHPETVIIYGSDDDLED